ncbi:MAG: methyltransferase domain-containing protein [Pseudomonadota bacterium]
MTILSDFLARRTPPDLYDAYLSPLFDHWAGNLLAAAPPSGRVLDIASGTGIVSRRLAASPGVTKVDALDVAAPMVAKAKAMGGDAKIAYVEASALDLPFDGNAFDAAYCQQGLQFFPDRIRALSEARRVLKPGGRLAAAVWTAASDGNPIFGAFETAVARRLGDDLIPFGPFSLGDRDAIAADAEAAGLSIISLERRTAPSPLPDPRTFVLFDLVFLGRPGPDGALQPLFDPQDPASDAEIEALMAEVAEAAEPYLEDNGDVRAPMTAHLLVAEA